MDNNARITALAQDIYLARQNRYNDVDGEDLAEFVDQTINWINQFIPEVEKEADWNFVRTNNDESIGTISDAGIISYALPEDIRKLVVSPYRDLSIRQDNTTISTFKLVSPNQSGDPRDVSIRDRATVLRRRVIFSRQLTDQEVGGTIVADTISWIPRLSQTDVDLLDLLDENWDIRQLFIYGVVKNQILPDIVQGGLTPSFERRYANHLRKCVAENNASADADDVDRETFGFVGGVW